MFDHDSKFENSKFKIIQKVVTDKKVMLTNN